MPSLIGPLVLLALNPRRELAVETFKAQLYDTDPGLVSTATIQTPLSRLRRAGLPIPPRRYRLDVAPQAVDIVDFHTRSGRFVEDVVRLVVVVKQTRHVGGQPLPSREGYERITVAVGRTSTEDLQSARAPATLGSPLVDTIGQGDAIAAAVHIGLLDGAPLDECADLASVLANEVAVHVGSLAGLPRRSTIAAAWDRYFPHRRLPAWIPRE